MEVAVAEEPQKKIFRARKTMKMSDRQQLEALHNTMATAAGGNNSSTSNSNSSSSRPQTPLVNGTHSEDGPKGREKDKELSHKETDAKSPGSPSSPHLSLALSRSPSPPDRRGQIPSPTPAVKKESEKGKKTEDKTKETKALEGGKDEKKGKEAKPAKEDVKSEGTKPDGKQKDGTSASLSTKTADKDGKALNGDTVGMDTDEPPQLNGPSLEEERREKHCKASSYSSSSSPSRSAGLESDPEVKEGFLCLSEEEDAQGEEEIKEEKMEMDVVKKGGKVKEEKAVTSDSTPSGKKRGLLEEDDTDGQRNTEMEREGKRKRVEGVELEAQLEVKITANAGSKVKLEKIVQQLVEERLRVLQLTVFDSNLQELRDRVEKLDCATKHQTTLNTLQAKIARLTKKFGAANQATESSKKTQTTVAVVAKNTHGTNAAAATQWTVKTTVEPKLTNQTTASNSVTASPAQPKPLSTPSTPTSSALAPILQIISTSTSSVVSSSTSSLSSGSAQAQTGTLLLKAAPGATGVMTSNPTVTSGGGQQMSIQPLLIQLPLAMAANGQSGALVTTHGGPGGGMGLIPVSSLASVSTLNKTKTTTPTSTTTFILQKAALTASSSSSSALALTSSPAVVARPVHHQGGSGMVSTPSAGVSVTTARVPTQCAAAVGVASTAAASSPATTGPAATGAASAGQPSAAAMASKTDNQASNSAASKTAVPPARAKGSVIDLTEDDDDVQVTGVRKAPVAPVGPVTQRPSGPPPPLISSTPTGSSARSSPQTGQRTGPQLTLHHRPPQDSPTKSGPGSSSSAAPSSSALPPLPLAPGPPPRLPPEASLTSLPQQPQLKLARVQSQNGIVLSWCVTETDRNCAAVDSYHLYAYHQDNSSSSTSSSSSALWKKIGEVKALPLPMACTLTQFVSGSTYYFAVRAKDVYGRFGPFCEPQCTDVISTSSS